MTRHPPIPPLFPNPPPSRPPRHRRYSWYSTPVPRPMVVAMAAPVTPSRGNGPSPRIRQGPSRMLIEFNIRSEEHTSELQSQSNLVCRLLLEKKKKSPRHMTVTDFRTTYLQPHFSPSIY